MRSISTALRIVLASAGLWLQATPALAQEWWNDAWTTRRTITLDTTSEGSAISTPIGTASILVRLYDGNFNFDAALDDGSDIRFIAEDGKTLLPHHIERYDRVLNEALVWVQVPDIKPNAITKIFLYAGNAAPASSAPDVKQVYDSATALVYHFSEASGTPNDATTNGIHAIETSLPVAGSLIAGGVRLTGQNPVAIPAAAPLVWNAGASITWSAWIKPAVFRENSVIFSRRENGNAFIIGENNGVPYVEITADGTTQRSPAGEPLSVDAWHHLAVTSSGNTLTLWLDGETYATLPVSLPALTGPSFLGKDGGETGNGFNGELDELHIANTARTQGWLKFVAINQGTSAEATRLLAVNEEEVNEATKEKPNFIKEHFGIFIDISRSLTADGWAVIGLCSILAVVGAGVAFSKFLYLNRIEKATKLFNQKWETLSNDIRALDRADEDELRTLRGTLNGVELQIVRQSPLFHIYHIGAHEIRKRIQAEGDSFAGLSGRSIEAIKARLDGGLVDEEEKLNSKLVFLTLSIAGGPYLGLLGTVIGVMITFAVIAKTGEVEVNSIAPGIAGALLATVAGLAVAIPALFTYSYLNSRITTTLNSIRKFIDEFITRIAEAYPIKE